MDRKPIKVFLVPEEVEMELIYQTDEHCVVCDYPGGWVDSQEHRNPIAICDYHLLMELKRGIYRIVEEIVEGD